jgi:hypothetical protein
LFTVTQPLLPQTAAAPGHEKCSVCICWINQWRNNDYLQRLMWEKLLLDFLLSQTFFLLPGGQMGLLSRNRIPPTCSEFLVSLSLSLPPCASLLPSPPPGW